MPPKKKGQGDDEAEACPADMDPEVWAVVKDVNQLVALASKRTSAPPVTRFDALLHLWSAVASKPRERDALVDAGALAASLAASKPDVAFLDRAAGLGLSRALTVGSADGSVPMSARHLETASDASLAASALEALIATQTSSRCVADALAILLGLARHASTRPKTIAAAAARGAPAWIALADATASADALARRDAASFLSLCARFGDAGVDADAAAAESAGVAIASLLATRTNALEHLLDAVCGEEDAGADGGSDGDGGGDDGDGGGDGADRETRPPAPSASPSATLTSLERTPSALETRREDARLAAAECLAACSRSDDAGDWLFRGFRAPRVARLARLMRRGGDRDAPARGAAATALFRAIDRGDCARAETALRRVLEEDAALRDPEPDAFDEPLEEEAERGAGEKRRKPSSRAPPLDLRREKLPGGYGQAARRSLAEKARSRGGDGDDAVVTIRRERARELRDAGGAAPATAFLSNARALFFAAGDAQTGRTDRQAVASRTAEDKRRDATRLALIEEGERSAAGLLRYLTATDAATTAAVIRAGGVVAAVASLARDDGETRRHAQAALWNVANVEMEDASDTFYTSDASAGSDENENTKQTYLTRRQKRLPVPRAHLEALRDAKAPGYVSKVLAYGDELEKLALRDTRGDS